MSATVSQHPISRYVRQARTHQPVPVTAMQSAVAQAHEVLIAAPWRPVETLRASFPRHHWAQSGASESYDAYRFCGDYDNDAATQHAYAGAVDYLVKLPDDALTGAPCDLISLEVTVHGDRWLEGGALLAAIPAVGSLPPDWDDLLNAAVVTPEPILAVDPSNTGPDTSLRVSLSFPASTAATPYLHLVLRLADYQIHRGAWIEGSAMLDAGSLVITYSREVTPDDPNPFPEDGHVDADHDGWSNLAEHYALSAPRDSRETPTAILNLNCDYAGRIEGGQIVIHAFGNPDMNGIPDAVFHVPLESWIVNHTTRFQARLDTGSPVSGHLREGPAWLFAFLDESSSGEYSPGRPAAVATYGPLPVSWGHNAVSFVFSNVPFGYVRHAWDATPPLGQYVRIAYTRDEVTTTVFEKVILGRNYIHEGDFLYLPETSPYRAQRAGLPMHAYDSEYAITIGEGANETTESFTISWWKYSTSRTPVAILPENLETIRTRDIVVRWQGDIRNAGWMIRLERFTGGAWNEVLLRYAYALAPYNASGFAGKFELCLNHAESSRIDLTDGTYRWSVSALINAVDTSADTISWQVGGGGGAGDFQFLSATSGGGLTNGKAGGASIFGEHIVPGGGGGGGLDLSSDDGYPLPGLARNGGDGANGGGGGGSLQATLHYEGIPTIYHERRQSLPGSGQVVAPVVGGYDGGMPMNYVGNAPENSVLYENAGCGGGGAAGPGGTHSSLTTGSQGGLGYRVALGALDDYFGCGGGGAGVIGGAGRAATDPTATTGQGGSTHTVQSGFSTQGADGFGDGGGGGYGSPNVSNTCGRGGTGAIYINEHLPAGENLVTLANDNANKTLDKTGVYIPSEGCSVVDVLVIGGGGGGGLMALHTTAGSAWGAFYAGGGGGGGGVLAILGLSVSNSHISVGFTEPFAFTVDTSDGEAPDGPFSVSGTLLDNLSEPAPLTLVLYRKRALAMDAQGRVREGFGGLPVAVQSVMSNAGSYSIQGLPRGLYLLVARLSAQPTGTGPLASLVRSYWYAEDDGRPKPFEIAGASVSGVDVTIG